MEIPKINLKKGFFNIDDKRNNIEENINLLEEKNNTLIFAAHSGNSEIAYFNDIHLLEENDLINLYYHSNKYTYEVKNKYLDDKNYKVEIKESYLNRIILITCNNNDRFNYLVIEAYEKGENY